MHKDNLAKRQFFAHARRSAVRIPAEAVFSYPDHSGSYAVHGSQFEHYMLLGGSGKTISGVIATYTFNDPSSIAVSARGFPRPARTSRSTPDLLFLAGA